MTTTISFTPPPGCSGGVNGVPLAAGSGAMNLTPANAAGTIVSGVNTPGGAIFPTNGIWPTQNSFVPGANPPYDTTFGRTAWTFTVDPTAFSNLANNTQWNWLLTSGAISALN